MKLTTTLAVMTIAVASIVGCGSKNNSSDGGAPAAPAEDVINFNIEAGQASFGTAGTFTKITKVIDTKDGDQVECGIDERSNSFYFWLDRKEGRKSVESIIVYVPRTSPQDGKAIPVGRNRSENAGTVKFNFYPEKGLWVAKKCEAHITRQGSEKVHFGLECAELENTINRPPQEPQKLSLRFQMGCKARNLVKTR